ncbi:MAG TPA: DUF2231 domain-containing protein [Methylomirabilota bacterium]|nr:DUF2231 domain-containing protein [Methylomirabilota bacterium]
MAHTRATVARHPVHPMLVVFPLGLWVAALVFDVVYAVTGNPTWRTLALYNIGAGIVGALAAAVPGFIDYTGMQGRAKKLATYHMIMNLSAVALYTLNAALRTKWGARFISADSSVPLVLSIIGVIGLGISGWLGGEMVYVERVGVEDPQERSDSRRRVA